MAEHLEGHRGGAKATASSGREALCLAACAKKKEKLISSAEQYKKVRAEHGYKRLKINAGYNALLAKQQQGAQVLTEREQSSRTLRSAGQSGKIRECCS
jgi:hypothetical protein